MEEKTCTKCGEIKPLTDFYRAKHMSDGRRPDCVSCHKKMQKKRREENIVDVKIYDMANGIIRRTSGKGRRCASYVKKGIECRIGSTRDEVITYINENFRKDIETLIDQGLSPSIDRINPDGHYEHGNLRIIEWIENTRLGVLGSKKEISNPIRVHFPDGNTTDYPSIIEAARDLGCKRDTIYASLKRPGINRRGLRFELLDRDAG